MKHPLSFQQVNCMDRWQIYHRLQELEIPCECAVLQPLKVEINTATAAIQLQSVIRQCTASRSELVRWLEGCWQIEC